MHNTLIAEAEARTDQANIRTTEANVRTRQAESLTDQANARTGAANTRTDEANFRTRQADTRAGQAEKETDRAQLRSIQADLRTDEANVRTTEANTRTDEANVRTEQAEGRENKMRASELSYRRLFEAARDGILILDAETGRITDANPFLVELLGFSQSEMVGKTVGELSPFKDIVSNQAMLEQLQKVGYVRYEDLPLETRDGRHIAVEFVSNVYQAGVIKVIQCNIRDVSARVKSEQTLHDTQARLNSALAAGAIGTWTWDIPNDRLRADEFTARMFSVEPGAAAEGLPAAAYLQAIAPADLPAVSENLARAIESCGHYDLEYRVQQKDGEFRWLQARGRVEGDAAGKASYFHGAVTDITERKRIEERFRRLVNSNAQGVIFWNRKGQITEANDFFLRLVGHSRLDLKAGTIDWMAMTPPEYARLDERALKELAATGVCPAFEKEYIRKDGSRVPILIGAATFADNPNEGVSFVLDLTERKAAKEALDRERNLLRLLIDNLPSCIYVKDIKGRYLIFNRASVRQLGLHSEAEALGKTVFDFFPPEIARLYEADDQQVLIGGQAITDREEPTQDHEGQRLWYLTTKLPLRDASGVFGLLGISQDITARKEAEAALRASEEHFRFLNDLSEATRSLADPVQIMAVMARMLGQHLHASRCAYADVEPDGEHFTIQHDYTDGCASTVGKYQLSLFGARAVSTLNSGKTLILRDVAAEVLPGEGAEMFNAIGIQAIITCPLVKEGGLRAMMAVHQAASRDWKPGEIAIVQDVVERCWETIGRRTAEEKIHQLNAGLEQRVTERTSQLEAANKELEAFSYSVSHDLRAPLRAVNGFAGIVLKKFAPQLPAGAQGYLERIRSGGQQMGALIDDLLEFSRLGRQSLNRQVVGTVSLVQDVLAGLATQREGRRIEIQTGTLPDCWGDPALLKQVWINLISNAIKYTSACEPAVIEIGCLTDNGEDIFFVRDNGAGFDMQYAHKLFGVFQRLHLAEEFEGTGVGLAIVQRIVHRHDGRVWAEAKVGQGATFRFTLAKEN